MHTIFLCQAELDKPVCIFRKLLSESYISMPTGRNPARSKLFLIAKNLDPFYHIFPQPKTYWVQNQYNMLKRKCFYIQNLFINLTNTLSGSHPESIKIISLIAPLVTNLCIALIILFQKHHFVSFFLPWFCTSYSLGLEYHVTLVKRN